MRNLATYARPAFLGDHPPVLARMVIEGTGEETTLPAGSVLGRDEEGNPGLWTPESAELSGILAGDVTVPASGGAVADVYIHASVVAEALIFADGVSDGDKLAALAELRLKGIYSSVTWAKKPVETGGESGKGEGE